MPLQTQAKTIERETGYATIPFTIDPWVREILRDPLNKSSLHTEGDWLVSDYGRRYPIRGGVYDLRLLTTNSGRLSQAWAEGQTEYERFSHRVASNRIANYQAERRGMEDVYREIPIIGRCLDVGGNDGRLRAFISEGQDYVSIDPFINVLSEPKPPEFWDTYTAARNPLNFVSSIAEHLPFASLSFDTVHMRSVLDHFSDPELALREAFRVLKPQGNVIIGLLVKGGRTGRDSSWVLSKEIVRTVLVGVGVTAVRDHHIWHPTYRELCALVEASGFTLSATHWQESEHDRVCYIKALKC
jgi:SAM-dependent methyltransferase